MENFQLERSQAYVQFAAPEVPPGMLYDPETLLVLPADSRYAAGMTRVIASVALGLLLFAGTAGVGYLAWSIATWRRGQTPAQRLLGLRCWDPEARRVLGRRQMAQRQFLGVILSGAELIGPLFFLFSVVTGRRQTSVGDFFLGTIILHDPEGTLPG